MRSDRAFLRARAGRLVVACGIGWLFALPGAADTVTYGQLLKAADAGNYRAQRELGKAFYLGTEGLPRDYDKAYTYLLKAAAQEDPTAEAYLARLYDEGNGVAKDATKAFDLYRRAANQGDDESRCRVGRMFIEGRVVKADPEKGFANLLHAASANYPPGQLAVANCYAKGVFVRADPVLAYKWALLASVALPEAQQALPDFRKKMTQAQIDAGQLGAEAWARRVKFGVPQDDLKIAFDDNGSRMKMDFVFDNSNICIPVLVQNRELVYMIVDTGAAQTVIDSDVAPELGISANDYNALDGLDNEMAMGADVGGVRIKLKSMTLSGVRVTVSSLLGAVAAFYDPHPFSDTRLGGIIGSDILSRFVIHIDKIAQTIEFILPNDFQYDRSDESLPLTFHGQIPMIEARVTNGPHQSEPSNFILDTGNGGGVTFTQLFTTANPTMELHPVLYSGNYGLCGPSPAALGKCSGLVLGSDTIPKPIFHVARLRTDVFSAGIIGNDLLRRFDFTIDYPHGQFYFKKYSDAALAWPFLYNRYGLVIQEAQHVPPMYCISKVWEGSAAGRAGLRVGDEVTAVNGTSPLSIPALRLIDALAQEGSLHLTVVRYGVINNVTLKSAGLPEPPDPAATVNPVSSAR